MNYDYKNIDVVLEPIQNSLRWAQEKYSLSQHFTLEKFKSINIFDTLISYRNYIIIIILNLFLILKIKKLKFK